MGRDLRKFVRRYTTLSSALDTLLNRRLVVLSPAKWDDQNDVRFMELYRACSDTGSLLALCFAMASETYHHWRVFAQGMEGICLEFDRLALERTVAMAEGFRAQEVEYLRVKDLEALGPDDRHKLPFVKRDGYSDEREWRIIAQRKEPALQTLDLPIDLSSITRVILNPWLPPPLGANLRKIIHDQPGCGQLRVESSRLTNSESWKSAGARLASLG